jgi:beta-glucosidase
MKRFLSRVSVTVAIGILTSAMLLAGLQGPPGGGAAGGRGGAGARGGPAAPAGPPAPVPKEVAIARPPAEANSAIAPVQTGVRNDTRHNAFVETAKNGDFDILFEGDSITDWWQQAAPNGGTDVQKKYFGDVKVANFAVAGDTTQGVLWGLQNGEGQGRKPKAVMLMIGTNNTRANSGPEIAEGVGAVVYELRKDFPDAKIMLLAIFPRGAGPTDASRVKNEEANTIIAKLDDGKHVFFRNINDKFLNPQGQLIGFRMDNLHPTAEGYEIWAKAVSDTLKGWAK